MPMGDRLAFFLGYGALFVAASLWIAHRFLLRDQEKVALAAQGGGALAAILLGLGLALRGFRVGYWPFHTAHELLAVGLLGLLLASLTLLLPRRDGLLLLILSALSSLLAVYGLLVGGDTDPAILVYDSGWWIAYVILCGFGGGALVVTSVAVVVVHSGKSEELVRGGVVARRALAWGLLALSAGLASGAWWFQRLSGRFWGDARWMGVVVAWLLTMAVWHGHREWPGQGWRSALMGVILGLAGGYVLLGLGGVG